MAWVGESPAGKGFNFGVPSVTSLSCLGPSKLAVLSLAVGQVSGFMVLCHHCPSSVPWKVTAVQVTSSSMAWVGAALPHPGSP